MARNRRGVETEALFARVLPDNLKQVRRSAAAVGVNLNEYIDLLIERDRKQLDHRYRPRWWKGPLPTAQTELFVTNEEESPSQSA